MEPKGILNKIKKAVRNGSVKTTKHARDELINDGFSPLDLDYAVRHAIEVRLQINEYGPSYIVFGKCPDGRSMDIVVVFEGRNVIIISVWEP